MLENCRLIQRTILMGELAFVDKENRLFVPLVNEVWINEKTGKFVRVLANRHRVVNVKTYEFKTNFKHVRFTWQLLFSANPDTMIIME